MSPTSLQKILLSVLISGLTITGVWWQGLEWSARWSKEYSLKSWLMVIHAGFGFVMMIVFGAFLSGHALPFLRNHKKRGRRSGILTIWAVSAVLLTSYLLYYGNEAIRAIASPVHFWVGIALVISIGVHRTR